MSRQTSAASSHLSQRGTAGLGTTHIPEHWGGSDITRPVPVRDPPSVRTYIPLPPTADASEAQHTGLCVQILQWRQRPGAGTSENYSKYCYSVSHCTVSGSSAFNKMKPIDSFININMYSIILRSDFIYKSRYTPQWITCLFVYSLIHAGINFLKLK